MNAPIRESLRSRRRRETQREIHLAAVRLAREHGFDKVTVDMISAAAGVSPRTFFNYFPSKDAAVVHGPTEIAEELAAAFVAAGPATPQDVLIDLARLLVRDLTERPPMREDMHAAFELAHANPQILAAMLRQFDAFRGYLADLVARRMGEAADAELPGLIAAVALAAMRQGMERWAQAPADASPKPYVERSLDALSILFTH